MAHNTGRAFENHVCQLLTLSGYKVERNAIVGGTQIDIVARSSGGLASVTYLVECTDMAGNVGIEYVKRKAAALLDADHGAEIVCLMVVARTGFSAEAKAFARPRPRLILRTARRLEDDLVDFAPYREWYTASYRESTGMFHEARLFDRYVDVSSTDGQGRPQSLDHAVREWLHAQDNNVLFLLGDYGAGKTSFLRHFAFELLDGAPAGESPTPLPLVIPLRESRSVNLRQAITDTLVNEYGVSLPSFRAFERYASLGKILLLLDGFDEMASKSDVKTILDCLTQILILAETNTKLVITCRSNFFHSHAQLFEMLRRFAIELPSGGGDRPETRPLGRHGKVLTLLPLTPVQIREFIARRFPGSAEPILTQIEAIHDLSDLCQRPVLLDMVLTTLPDIHAAEEVVNSAALYETYTDRWALRDQWRVKMPVDARQALCDSLAWAMLARRMTVIGFPELRAMLEVVLAGVAANPDEMEEFANDIQTCSFLVRSGEDEQYQFAHKSFMEYFVARRLARALSGSVELGDSISATALRGRADTLKGWVSHMGFSAAREALRERLGAAGAAVWFTSNPGRWGYSVGSTLEERVSEVFDVDRVGVLVTDLPFEITPEIAAFALEWLQMQRVSIADVMDACGEPGKAAVLTDVLRYGGAVEYLTENASDLAAALERGLAAGLAAAVGAALLRTAHVDDADGLLALREYMDARAFSYVLFSVAQEGKPERVALLRDLDGRGDLDDFGSIVATYGQRDMMSDGEYAAALLTKVGAFASSDREPELAVALMESVLPGEEGLIEMVGRLTRSDASVLVKVKAVELLEALPPSAHSHVRKLWTRVPDPDVRARLQKVEERLRSTEATERDRQRWRRGRDDGRAALWKALALPARA